MIAMRNKVDITTVKPGDIVYVDLRFFGGRWYESLSLPDAPTSYYVMQYQYTHWYHDVSYGHSATRPTRSRNTHPFRKNKISGKFLLLEGHVPEKSCALHWKTYMVFTFDPKSLILVDDTLARAYPRILER